MTPLGDGMIAVDRVKHIDEAFVCPETSTKTIKCEKCYLYFRPASVGRNTARLCSVVFFFFFFFFFFFSCVFWVRVCKSYRTSYRSSDYGYGSLTELVTEVPGMYTNIVHRTGTRTRVFLKGRTRTPGILPRAHRTYIRSGYECECRSYLSCRRSGTRNIREPTPGVVLYVPYRTQA